MFMDTQTTTSPHARMLDPVELGRRLRVARKAQTIKAIATQVGVHENTIGKWERGETVPSALQLLELSYIYFVKIEELLGPGPQDEPLPPPADAGADLRWHEAVIRGEFLHVPLFNLQGAADAHSLDTNERVVEMRYFEDSFLWEELGIKHLRVGLAQITGSAAGGRFHSGDLVLFDREDTSVTVEGLHLIRIDQALLLKELVRRPGRMVVRNPGDPTSEFDVRLGDGGQAGPDFQVIGRCRWAGMHLR